jgi:hypothetical protein
MTPDRDTLQIQVQVNEARTDLPVPDATVTLAEAFPQGISGREKTNISGTARVSTHHGSFNQADPQGLLLAARGGLGIVAEKAGYHAGAILHISGNPSPAKVLLYPIRSWEEANGDIPESLAPLLYPGETVTLRLDQPRDLDSFTIPLPCDAELDLELSQGKIETYLRLLDSSGTVVAERGGRVGGPNHLVLPLRKGNYRLEVTKWGRNATSPEPFTLRCKARWLPDPAEPNDSPGSSQNLSKGSWLRGFLAPSRDIDRHRFTVNYPTWIRLERGAASIEHYVQILDQAEKVVAGHGFRKDGGRWDLGLPPGRYTFSITEWGMNSYSIDPYLFRIYMAEDEMPDPEMEGPQPARETQHAPLPGLVSGSIQPIGDKDVYQIQVPCRGRVVVNLETPLELWLEVRDAQGKVLAQQGQRVGRQHFQWDTPGPGSVYLVVRKWGDNATSPDPYVLRLWHIPHGELDEIHPNDTLTQAMPLRIHDPIKETIFPLRDQDYYSIQVDHPSRLALKIETPLELFLRIVGPSGENLMTRGIRIGSAHLNLPVPRGGTILHFQEWGNNSASPQPYSLNIQLHRDDSEDYNLQLPESPRHLQAGVGVQFSHADHRNQDHFLVEVTQAGTVFFDMVNRIEAWMKVFDDRTGVLLFQSGFRIGTGRHSLKVNGPTRLRIQIEEWGRNAWQVPAGFLRVSTNNSPFGAELISAKVDPLEPRRVSFSRKKLARVAGFITVKLDAAGNGKYTQTIPESEEVSFEYSTKGRHLAHWIGVLADKSEVHGSVWVDATGARARDGLQLSLLSPIPGAVLDHPQEILAQAFTYARSPLTGVQLELDGTPISTLRRPPYSFKLPWKRLDRGYHRLQLTASDTRGRRRTLTGSFLKDAVFGLSPENGAVISGKNVAVRWDGGTFGSSLVKVRKLGETEWTRIRGDSGRVREVRIFGLEPGTAYEFQPDEPGAPIRKVTRVPGLAFGSARYSTTIPRDYDQRLGISVRNNSDKPRTLQVHAEPPDPATGLLVGFVGEGSRNVPLTLTPGEERDLWLGLSAQDAMVPKVRFSISLSSTDGSRDEAEVEVHIRLPEVKLTLTDMGPTADGLGSRIKLTNQGDALTDVSMKSSNPKLHLRPQVTHTPLVKGATLEVIARPELTEGFTSIESIVSAEALNKLVNHQIKVALPEGESLHEFPIYGGVDLGSTKTSEQEDLLLARAMAGAVLNPKVVDWKRHHENPEDLDGDGRPDRWSFWDATELIRWIGEDSDGDGEVDFVLGDVMNDGVMDHAASKQGQDWQRTNVVDAWLEVAFQLPWARDKYQKHDLEVILNDRVVGLLKNQIPEGNETFRIPPNLLAYGEDGRPAGNRVEMRSKHLRGGHYVVSTDFRIKIQTTGGVLWSAGKDRQEAQKRLPQNANLLTGVPDLAVSSSQTRLSEPPRAGTKIFVRTTLRNIGAVTAHHVAVGLFRSTPGGRGVELARVEVPEVPLNRTIEVSLPWTVAPGTHSLEVRVDPEGALRDPDNANNHALLSVQIPGKDAPPELKILKPGPDETLLTSRITLRSQAHDDAGIARATLTIDGSLEEDLDITPEGEIIRSVLLQPGTHRLLVRVLDGSGQAASQTLRVRVKVPSPKIELLNIKPGAKIDAREVKVQVRADPGLPVVAARVSGGPWVRAPASQDGHEIREITVPLTIGPGEIEVMGVNDQGVQGRLKQAITGTRARTQEVPPASRPATASGKFRLSDGTEVDAFGPPSGILEPRKQPSSGTKTRPHSRVPAQRDLHGPREALSVFGNPPENAGHAPATNLQPQPLPNPKPVPGVVPQYPPADQPISQSPQTAVGSTNTPPTSAMSGKAPPLLGNSAAGFSSLRGGQVATQVRKQDWYCTNRPKVGIPFELPPFLRHQKLPLPGTSQYKEMLQRLLQRMRIRGFDTSYLEKLQELLLRRVSRLEQGEPLPDFLQSVAPLLTDRLIGYQDKPAEWEVNEWRDAMQARAEAWYLRLLSSGDPKLILKGLQTRAKALGQFDEALQETAQAAISTVQANQKIAAEVIESLGSLVVPQVGLVFDVYALATGENVLTGEKAKALDQVLRLVGVAGPGLTGRILRDFPEFRPALAKLAEFGKAGGDYGVRALADRLGVEPEVVQASLNRLWDELTRERRLGANPFRSRAQSAARAFEESLEGAADLRRMRVDEQEARSLLARLERAAPGSDDLEDVVRSLQANKTAQRLINQEKLAVVGKHGSLGFEDLEDLRRKAKEVVEKKWYRAADSEVKAGFQKMRDATTEAELQAAGEAMGLSAGEAKRFRQEVDKVSRRTGIPGKDIDVDPLFITNKRPPSKGVKKTSFGRDRDVTYVLTSKKTPRGARPGSPRYQLGDLDHALTTKPYQRAIWKATGKGELPKATGTGQVNMETVARYADDMDQAVTSGQHLEAYNTGEVQLDDFLDKGKLPALTRIEDVRDAVVYKSTHWFNRAKRATNPLQRSRDVAEGMRQATKQWKDLILPRARQYGLDPRVHLPSRLEAGMEVFEAVGKGKISAAQGEHMLKAMGTDAERIVQDMGSYLEGLEKGAGVGHRRLRSLSLVNQLQDLRKQHVLWKGEGLRSVNEALKNGDISGAQYVALRKDILRDAIQEWKLRAPTEYMKKIPAWAKRLVNLRVLASHEQKEIELLM